MVHSGKNGQHDRRFASPCPFFTVAAAHVEHAPVSFSQQKKERRW